MKEINSHKTPLKHSQSGYISDSDLRQKPHTSTREQCYRNQEIQQQEESLLRNSQLSRSQGDPLPLPTQEVDTKMETPKKSTSKQLQEEDQVQ